VTSDRYSSFLRVNCT